MLQTLQNISYERLDRPIITTLNTSYNFQNIHMNSKSREFANIDRIQCKEQCPHFGLFSRNDSWPFGSPQSHKRSIKKIRQNQKPIGLMKDLVSLNLVVWVITLVGQTESVVILILGHIDTDLGLSHRPTYIYYWVQWPVNGEGW